MKANRYLCYVFRPPRYKKSISELFKGNPRHLIENFRLRKLYFLGFRYPERYSSFIILLMRTFLKLLMKVFSNASKLNEQ